MQLLPLWSRFEPNTDMKFSWKFLSLIFLFVGFVLSCSEPDPKMAELQRYYAQKGEGMIPTIEKVEQRNTNPQRGTTPHLSTTNAPVQN